MKVVISVYGEKNMSESVKKVAGNAKHFSTTLLGILLFVSLLPQSPEVQKMVSDLVGVFPQFEAWVPTLARLCQLCGSLYLIFGVGRKLRGSIS